VAVGVCGEKDPGEKGLDYLTFNLNFKDLGVLEALHFGNYRLAFGQGLVMNTNFSMGKTSDVIYVHRKGEGIKRHVSTNEGLYFSGMAGTIRKENVRVSFFYSDRKQDATGNDSTIYTFKTDGYHRVPNDLLKREMAPVIVHGGHIEWQKDRWTLGMTGVQYFFGGKTLNPRPRDYNAFYLRGRRHSNTGFHYDYQSKKVHLQGEMAVDGDGWLAGITNILIRPASFADGVLSLRYYDKQYNALYGKGFSESGEIRNETGLYAGFRLRLSRKWELLSYFDRFIFPWLRYGVSTPSSGKDISARIKFYLSPDCKMEWRYRFKEKQANSLPYEQHRWRYRCDYSVTQLLKIHLQADYNQYNTAKNHRQGWSGLSSFSYLPSADGKFQLDGGLMYFQTDDWSTRIAVFEKNILYAFGFPTYYGRGMRYYAVMKWKVAKCLSLYLKCGSTRYFDRQTVGTGLEAISGREKTDIYCLIKYNF
jgi:hypothetical protein